MNRFQIFSKFLIFKIVIALAALSILDRIGFGADRFSEGPFVIHQITGNPFNPSEVFAITSNYGFLKSEDGGLTWKSANQGLKSFTHHAIAMNGFNPPRIYLGAWGGGLSLSEDGGASWIEMNDSLGNTAIDAIAVDRGPAADQLYIATSTHLYRTGKEKGKWVSFEEGLPPFPDEIRFKTLLLLPGRPKTLWLGTALGLFYRPVRAPRWKEERAFSGIRVSALAYDEKEERLWAGTVGKGLLHRGKNETEWRPANSEKGLWISQIVLDPADSKMIYLSSRGKGVFKSSDGGGSWTPSNNGLEDLDIRSLALHPLNRSLLFAGTTAKGIFRSTDGSSHWDAVQPMPALTMAQIIGMLSLPPKTAPPPDLPGAIGKCNLCHGWTDPDLNQKETYWRVPPNRRNWKETVARMGARAALTPDEASALTRFLNSYSRKVSR